MTNNCYVCGDGDYIEICQECYQRKIDEAVEKRIKEIKEWMKTQSVGKFKLQRDIWERFDRQFLGVKDDKQDH